MKLSHLSRFVAVAERGSMRAASRQLGIPQPVISRSIQEMERELGVQLFERTSSGIVMTPVAERIIQRANVVQNELQRTLDEVEQYKGLDGGTLTIGLSPAAHVAILPRVLAPFRKRYPKVRLKVVEGLFPYLEADIRDGLNDIYVGPVAEATKSRDLEIAKLMDNERMIVGRRDHPLSAATSIEELRDALWVTTPVNSDSENEVNAIYASAGLPSPNIVAQATSGMSILSVVASSDLLAPLPRLWEGFIVATNLLTRIPIREVTFAPAMCSVHQGRIPLAPAAQHMHDLISRTAANQARLHAREVSSAGI